MNAGPRPEGPNQIQLLQKIVTEAEFSALLDVIGEAQRMEIEARHGNDVVRLRIMDLEKKYRRELMAISAPPTLPAPVPIGPPVAKAKQRK